MSRNPCLVEERVYLGMQARRLRLLRILLVGALICGLIQPFSGSPAHDPESNQYVVCSSPPGAMVFTPASPQLSSLRLGQEARGSSKEMELGPTPLLRTFQRGPGGGFLNYYPTLLLRLEGYQEAELTLPSVPTPGTYGLSLIPQWPQYVWWGPWHWMVSHWWGAAAIWSLFGASWQAVLYWRAARHWQEQNRTRSQGIRPGVELGGYLIEKELGHGGMGRVYLGRNLVSGEPVAIKLLFEQMADDPDSQRRFQREIDLMRQLHHPNVVHLLDYGQVDRHVYLVTEYLCGTTMQDAWQGKQSPATVVAAARQIVAALSYAHKCGLVHRDLKPANLMFQEDGRLKLLDFGIATHATAHASASTSIRGSVGYMAPEQISGLPVDWRADLYSLGVILHEALSGEPLFGHCSHVLELLRRHLEATPPPLEHQDPDLASFVLRLLAKRPEDRFTTPEQFLAEAARVGLADKA